MTWDNQNYDTGHGVMRTVPGVFGQQLAAGVTEYSIWDASVPGTYDTVETASTVLGTKFRTDTAGEILGIRWYRNAGSSGVADVALWQTTTNISGTTTVTGQTASGWQRMDFATPVAISASTIYIATARFSAAKYHAQNNGFGNAVINGPLEGVASATSANGVWVYSGSMVVPTGTYQATSYFIDVIFAA